MRAEFEAQCAQKQEAAEMLTSLSDARSELEAQRAQHAEATEKLAHDAAELSSARLRFEAEQVALLK
jgi:hypothetical protein